jgi:hypothetical protein
MCEYEHIPVAGMKQNGSLPTSQPGGRAHGRSEGREVKLRVGGEGSDYSWVRLRALRAAKSLLLGVHILVADIDYRYMF